MRKLKAMDEKMKHLENSEKTFESMHSLLKRKKDKETGTCTYDYVLY